jgi:hypothetical protein
VGSKNEDRVRRWVQPLGTTLEEVQAAVEEFCEPDVDYYPVAKWPEARPCHGREEFSQFLTRFREAWLRYEWAIDELIPVGNDRVLACLNLRAEGRESGMNLEGNLYQCIWLRHERFFRIEDHLTLSGALHALGFEGETLEAAGLRTPSNLDVVQSIFTMWGRGDFASAEWAHPEIEFTLADGLTRGTWKGLAGLAEGWRSFLSAWENWRGVADEYRVLDDDRILVLLHASGRGKTSGLEIDGIRGTGANIFQLHGGKVTKLIVYMDAEQALADLGLLP